jgi:hypothetical protein
VRLDSPHRSHDRYLELGQRLLGIGLPTIAYHQPLDQCWLARHHEAQGVKVEPGGKDTLSYHCVQHEKSAWLAEASRMGGEPMRLIWLDYGILHVPGVTEDLIREFYAHVARQPPNQITMPGIWPADSAIDDSRPCWICAGGVVVMPWYHAGWWHRECVRTATHARPTWEVNTWAKVARDNQEQVRLYKADHDSTILTGIAS